MTRLLYFAWLRDRVGKPEEMIEIPAEVVSVSQLIEWLQTRGDEYAYAFEKPALIRCALDRKHSLHSAAISGAREIAFFPPMTGG